MEKDTVKIGEDCRKEPTKSTPKFSARFLGSMPVSRLYPQTFQSWVMAEVHRKRESVQDVVVQVVGETLIVRSSTGQEQHLLFQQNLKGVTQFAKLHQDPKCFAYLTRYQTCTDFQCYVYLADSDDMIPHLFQAIRDASKECSKPVSGETTGQSSVDNKCSVPDGGDADMCKSLFEVKYMGRVKLGGRRVTSDYIDSLADRMVAKEAKVTADKLEELEPKKKQEEQDEEVWRIRHASGASVKSLPGMLDAVAGDLTTENKLEQQKEMLKKGGLRSPQLKNDTDVDDSLGSVISAESAPLLKESSDLIEQAGQSIALKLDFQTDSESSKDSLNASLEQKLNHLSIGRSQPLKIMRSLPLSGDGTRRRHSSQTEDRSWPGSKFSFQDSTHERQRHNSVDSQDSICTGQRQHDASHIMVLQIGQQDISLISLDKKVSILHCNFKDISFVSQGSHKQDLFGIVARDASSTLFCYMLRCLTGAVATEIMSTLSTAFTTAYNRRGSNSTTSSTVGAAAVTQNQVCTSCPHHHFHRICQEIHSLSPQAAYDVLVKKVHLLPDKEFNELNHLMQVEAPESFGESLEVIMIFLRKLCERKQKDHVHISETIRSGKSDMLPLGEKHSLFEGLKNKAKKSLTTSFENILSRGKKKEDTGDAFRQRSWTTDSETSWTSRDSSTTSTPDVSPMPSPLSREFENSFPSPPASPGPHRRRSVTMDSLVTASHADRQLAWRRDVNHNTTSSPLKTMFLLSTSSPQHSDSLPSSVASSPAEDTNFLTAASRRPSSSWRKAIFNRVCTPQHSVEQGEDGAHADGKLHSTAEIRAMWKKLILESLLLIRMEKENHNIRARQEEGGVTLSHKLVYEELTPCLKEITSIWEKMLSLHDEDEEEVGEVLMVEEGKTIPKTKLLEYVKKGVPRTLRGQIWLLLMQQQHMRSTVPDSARENSNYEDLLKQLTTHQHAILIDLGRTFPNHPYFSKSLGAGQLELFNLLKAYSLLDTEVGYCQGLSFIVGMLLLHMEEISAFHVLKYLMYDLALRKQFRPNMMALQLKLYQLTRLLHDRYKEVYDHFESHEISPTLYAAPWFLTMFASQFPLGFVARVFDMVFIQGIDALFKVALTLIGSHDALILQCDSFETIVDFLKTTLPEMVQVQMERIINQAFELDIDRELQAYEVEYQVLSEEMTFSSTHHLQQPQYQHHSRHDKSPSPSSGMAPERPSRLGERRSPGDLDLYYALENQSHALRNQNMELLEKLQHAHSQRQSLELNVLTQQVEMDKLKSHIRAVELERAALLSAVAKLRELVPQDALQDLQLSLPSALPETSGGGTLPGETVGSAELGADTAPTSELSGSDQLNSKANTKSLIENAEATCLFAANSALLVKLGSGQTSRTLNFDRGEVRSSSSLLASGYKDSDLFIREAEPDYTSLSATTTIPSYTCTSLSFSSTGDVARRDFHSQKIISSVASQPSTEADFLPQLSGSSSGVAAQTGFSRNILSSASEPLAHGALSSEERQKTVKVVVQQSPTGANPQRSPSSER